MKMDPLSIILMHDIQQDAENKDVSGDRDSWFGIGTG
jgi:hypothetical protein